MVLVTDTYQSRVDNETTILMRQDPIIYSDPRAEVPHGLAHHQLKNYQKNGFILLKGLFSEQEAGLFLREARKMTADPKIRRREEAVAEPGSDAGRSVFMVHRLSELYRQLVSDVRVANIARQILGSEVYIHQSRVNLKAGFSGKEFHWHSDFETWHVEDGMPRMRALSCVIFLTENNEFNGPLMLMPGSHMHYISCAGETLQDHYQQSLRKQRHGIADPAALSFLAERGGIQSMKGPAGSVVFFDCNTMHGSNSNISPYPRANLFFVYNSVENTLESPRGGLKPRPEFMATRQDFSPMVPLEPAYGGRK
ncbi:MAG: ectoine hydroxylase [Betaproteobacteria bacterium SG8_41]|nr:MAG: ectoine hydroxylase [Betaproteobacteria bacterium SG8_41]